jgi:acyl-CoA dehydrogenase
MTSGDSLATVRLIAATTEDIIDAAPANDGFAEGAWRSLCAAGLHLIGVAEDRGGVGGSWPEARSALAASAGRAVPIPLAEVLFGVAPALSGLPMDPGDEGCLTSSTFAASTTLRARPSSAGWRLDGIATRLPFARHASSLVVLATNGDAAVLARIFTGGPGVHVEPGLNVAEEPRDDVRLAECDVPADRAAVIAPARAAELRRLAALARAVQMGAACERVVSMTVRYAGERKQFGRPISRFQAVAHQIAAMIGETAVVNAAVEAAFGSIGSPAEEVAIASVKSRAAQAATLVAGSAHQVFGALGFTQEHPLHSVTRRLWSWRDEVGRPEEWQRALGGIALASGAESVWPLLSGTLPAGSSIADAVTIEDNLANPDERSLSYGFRPV